MFGFKSVGQPGEHAMWCYLIRLGARQRRHVGKSCQWLDSNYNTVMIVNNRGGTDYECFILETEEMRHGER